MNVLLDTHFLIWALTGPDNISKKMRDILETSSGIYFSTINIMEIGIKKSKGKMPGPHMPSDFYTHAINNRWKIISFDHESADVFVKIPVFHNDPFDRMLIAQAMHHNMAIATVDQHFQKYKINVVS